MKKIFAFLSMIMFATVAVAQAVEPAPSDLLGALLRALADWQSVGWQAGVAALLTILISTVKLSWAQVYWNKLGYFKVFVAPVLSLVAVAIAAPALDAKAMYVAITTGAGAVFLHQILDSVKKMPGLKKPISIVIDIVSKLLGKPSK